MGFSDPLEAGMFRRTQVFVGDHIPPHADHIEVLMKSFVPWVQSDIECIAKQVAIKLRSL